MIYRTIAGEKVSQLGFGAMRMPSLAGGAVDVPEATRMMHRAFDGGVNYFDTAYVYHGGASEGIVGQALRDRRGKVFIATKSPIWEVKSKADFPRLLDEQLARLGTDYVDFYLLHALNAGSWKTCLDFDAIPFLEAAKKAGKVRHFGFSFHDRPEVFPPILEHYPWEFCQIQYNYLDRDPAKGHPGLAAPAARGADVVVMEPLRGGNLAGRLPEAVQSLFDAAPVKRSPAEWALRWVWDRPEPKVVLSGMSTMAQVEENLRVAGEAGPGNLDAAGRALVDKVESAMRGLIAVPCTSCRYCMPCPHGVDIPRNLNHYNEWFMFAKNPAVRAGYTWVPEPQRAGACKECGLCEDKCPQRIPIMARLKEAHAALA